MVDTIEMTNHKINNADINNFHCIVTEYKLENTRTRIAVLGTGNYGRALAAQFYKAGVDACVGSRYPKTKLFQGLSLFNYEEAIQKSDIVVLCIPAHTYDNVLAEWRTALIGKTVVEISNLENVSDSSNALRVQQLLPRCNIVKALNTVSAYALEHESYGVSRETYVCGDNNEQKVKVMQILRELGLNPIDQGGLRSAVMLEKMPFRFFSEWRTAILITFLTLIPILLYTYLQSFWYQSETARSYNGHSLRSTNVTIAWLMHTLLALVFLPGAIAGFIQIIARTKYMRFPNWLDSWLKSRKQLGLISLFLASIHGCLSCLAVGAGEAKHTLIATSLSKTTTLYQNMDSWKQASMIVASFALALMAVLGITSLPSVNSRMSWKEWDFIQRGVGFLSLIVGTLHVLLLMKSLWDPNYARGWNAWKTNPKGIFPPAAFIMPIFPLLVILLKFVLMLPGLSCYLNSIRKGKIGYKSNVIEA